MCFPHELLGYEREDYAGILLSIEIATELDKKQKQYAKSNKSKAHERQRRAPRRPRASQSKSRANPERPTR